MSNLESIFTVSSVSNIALGLDHRGVSFVSDVGKVFLQRFTVGSIMVIPKVSFSGVIKTELEGIIIGI